MDLLPGLSAAEQTFAQAYFPVFSDAKMGLLIIAGNTLLMLHNPDQIETSREGLQQGRERITGALTSWRELTCPPGLERDYQTVAEHLSRIKAAVEAFQHQPPDEIITCAEQLSDTLWSAYGALRQVALSYWRLELVPESAHHHHH